MGACLLEELSHRQIVIFMAKPEGEQKQYAKSCGSLGELFRGISVFRSKVISPWCYKTISLVLVIALAGCGGKVSSALEGSQRQKEPRAASPAVPKNEALRTTPGWETNLVHGTPLAELAIDLDRQATLKSPAVVDIDAAKANVKARRFDRYPQLRPTASAPLTGDREASFGLNLEQVIWDGGRVSARLADAEQNVAEATFAAWKDRNDRVFEGLAAFVELGRREERLREWTDLRKEFQTIFDLLEIRRDGGVADRGETLRMVSALQEVDRQVVADTYALREARTNLTRLLPAARQVSDAVDMRAVASQCQRAWPFIEPPADALSRVALSRAESTEKRLRAQRFPKLVLSAGTVYSEAGWSEPSVGLQLDATDMLGLGRQGDVQAAAASKRSAEATYALQREDTQVGLARLEAGYQGMQSDITTLQGLSDQNDETISLFKEQLKGGSISLTDGIVLHRERTDTRISLVDVYANVVLNCLESSRILGLLVPYGARND